MDKRDRGDLRGSGGLCDGNRRRMSVGIHHRGGLRDGFDHLDRGDLHGSGGAREGKCGKRDAFGQTVVEEETVERESCVGFDHGARLDAKTMSGIFVTCLNRKFPINELYSGFTFIILML